MCEEGRDPIEKNNITDGSIDLVFLNLYSDLIKHQNLKDLTGVFNCFHSDSMGRNTAKKILEPLFSQFTVNNTIVKYRYVGSDGEYIYYRFIQKIESIAGPNFNDMLAENLVLFRQQSGAWKVWDQLVLMMKPINRSQL